MFTIRSKTWKRSKLPVHDTTPWVSVLLNNLFLICLGTVSAFPVIRNTVSERFDRNWASLLHRAQISTNPKLLAHILNVKWKPFLFHVSSIMLNMQKATKLHSATIFHQFYHILCKDLFNSSPFIPQNLSE